MDWSARPESNVSEDDHLGDGGIALSPGPPEHNSVVHDEDTQMTASSSGAPDSVQAAGATATSRVPVLGDHSAAPEAQIEQLVAGVAKTRPGEPGLDGEDRGRKRMRLLQQLTALSASVNDLRQVLGRVIAITEPTTGRVALQQQAALQSLQCWARVFSRVPVPCDVGSNSDGAVTGFEEAASL